MARFHISTKQLVAILTDSNKLQQFLDDQPEPTTAQQTIRLASTTAQAVMQSIGLVQVNEHTAELLLRNTAHNAGNKCNDRRCQVRRAVAIVCCGAVYADFVSHRQRIEAALRTGANEPVGVIYEAASEALWCIAKRNAADAQRICQSWLNHPSNMELRAILAAIGHTSVANSAVLSARLSDIGFQVANLCAQVLMQATTQAQKDNSSLPETTEFELRILEKVLSVAPSVLTQADADRGFRMLERWANTGHAGVMKLVASNLRKARLWKNFPEKVERVGELLQGLGEAHYGDDV